MITFFLNFIWLLPSLLAQSSDDAKINRLVAFGKLANDIKQFSPTDIVDSMLIPPNWENIMWNGVRMARTSDNDRAFADSLIKLFQPIEPSLKLTYRNINLTNPPEHEPKDLVVGRQLIGLPLYARPNKSFQSIRTNRRSLIADDNLNYFTLLSIKLPKGTNGKIFELKLKYHCEKDRLFKSYKDLKFSNDFQLNRTDSIYLMRDSIPPSSKVFAIKLGMVDDIGKFNIGYEDSILIDGKSYKIDDLKDLSPTQSKDEIEFRMIENDAMLFKETNIIGDSLTLQLTENIQASFPLAVYADKVNTYPLPSSTTQSYPYNKGIISRDYPNDTALQKDLDVRIANILVIWNIFRVAYVYNPFNEKSETAFLKDILREVLNITDVKDYDFTLLKMMHAYKDAHIFYSNKLFDADRDYSAPITLIHLNDGFYIKKLEHKTLSEILNLGDKLVKIDGEIIDDLWKAQQYYATGSHANIINRAGVFGLLYGKLNSEAELTFQDVKTKLNKQVTVIRDFKHPEKFLYTSFLDRTDNRMLNDSTYYFNMSQNPLSDTLLHLINNPRKHIIFDLRGYITIDSEEKNLLNKLVQDTIVQNNMFDLHLLSPEKKKFVADPLIILPENKLPKAKFYFLISASTQSAPESFLDVIKYWKVGTLIGKNTAGANGNINYLTLPGGINLTFSGVKVINSDGTIHHLDGIPPDYEVDYTIDDVVNHRDPFIVKALKLIANEIN